MIRNPVAAGKFYPASKKALESEISAMADASADKKNAVAAISPHAGYVYSGPVACKLFSNIRIPDSIIILGPNHTGIGENFAVYKKGIWRTPMGDIEIDEGLADDICGTTELLKNDLSAHMYEHSIEVQLPIMQYFKNDFRIVPIVLGNGDFQQYQQLASTLARAVKNQGRDILIVASSDMTHYEPQALAETKDKTAIDSMLKLDEKLLYDVVKKHDITMCGYVPAIIAISAAKQLGAKSAELVMYSTSGDITGDYSSVVGYAGILIE
jgi:MEMO1 family protein